MAALTEATLAGRLLDLVPDLKAPWAKMTKGGPLGNHILVGVVLYDHVLARLADGKDDADLERIFAFVEAGLKEGDEKVRNALAVSFLYSLAGAPPASVKKARRLMGPATLKEYDAQSA